MSDTWTQLLQKPPADLVLIHELGLPNDPASIYGAEILAARQDGSLTLQWKRAQESGALSARVDPKIVRRWAELLATGGFPDFPPRQIAPGASFRIFEAQAGTQRVRAVLSRFHFEDQPPYEELCAIADSVCAQMRGRKCWADPDPARGLVRDVKPLDAP